MTFDKALFSAAEHSAQNYTASYNELDHFMEANRYEWTLAPRKARKILALRLASTFWDNASDESLQAFDSWVEVARIMENAKEW